MRYMARQASVAHAIGNVSAGCRHCSKVAGWLVDTNTDTRLLGESSSENRNKRAQFRVVGITCRHHMTSVELLPLRLFVELCHRPHAI